MESSEDSQNDAIESVNKAGGDSEDEGSLVEGSDSDGGDEEAPERPEELFARRQKAFREGEEEEEMGDEEWDKQAAAAQAARPPRKSYNQELDELGAKYDSLAFLKTTPERDPDLFYDSDDSENEVSD